jgi:hypothetical protein
MSKNDNEKKLKELEELENNSKKQSVDENYLHEENIQSVNANIIDGYKVLERCDLPQNGLLYPETWNFAYRCPTTKEVANFSTISEGDQPAIIAAVEDLIRKCVVIFDSESNNQISAGQINDAHRTFFILLIRDFYLPGSPISYDEMCTLHKEQISITLGAHNLKYGEIPEKLLNAFDGRKFSLSMPNIDEPIDFLLPTIEITGRIFKYVVNVYRSNQKDRENKDDKIVYDKQFLLIAPYLYIRGNETVKELIQKFKKIQDNDDLFKAYLDIATKLKLDNLDYTETTCPVCGSLEETQIRFPGGWKSMFINKKDSTGYFN